MIMKAEELMLNDYVLWRDRIARVETIWRNSNAITLIANVRGVEMIASASLCDVKPITITKEILEKNGFTIGMNTTLELGDDKWLEFYHHKNRLRMWWKGIDEWENHSKVQELVFQCHVWYVHELQHALRLAKIDKEIKL